MKRPPSTSSLALPVAVSLICLAACSSSTSNPPAQQPSPGVAPASVWLLTNAAADFDHNGTPDLLFQNRDSRQLSIWYMGGPNSSRLRYELLGTGLAGWRLAGAGDFDRDGAPDLVFQNDTTRQVTVWYMGGAGGIVRRSFAFLDGTGQKGWLVAAVADLNGDGIPDLIWQNQATGAVTVWFMGGKLGDHLLRYSVISNASLAGWKVVAAADFNRDGIPDLVWQNDATRQSTLWYMTGKSTPKLARFVFLAPVGQPGWRLASAADLDANKVPDLLWQSGSTGQVNAWFMSGHDGSDRLRFAPLQ
jgi:hypothetical protein